MVLVESHTDYTVRSKLHAAACVRGELDCDQYLYMRSPNMERYFEVTPLGNDKNADKRRMAAWEAVAQRLGIACLSHAAVHDILEIYTVIHRSRREIIKLRITRSCISTVPQ